MTPLTELARLFADIPRPEPLCGKNADRWCIRCFHEIDPVDADETNHGVCAQGESDEFSR